MPPFIPYQTFKFETSLSVAEAVRLVTDAIAPRRSLFQWRTAGGKAFEGSVSSSGFSISRAIGYRNSFLPYLYGTFVQTPYGVQVKVRMTLNPLVIAFSIVWCGFIGVFGLLAAVLAVTSGRVDPSLVIPVLMLLFYVGMVLFGFGVEAGKATRFLNELFALRRIF